MPFFLFVNLLNKVLNDLTKGKVEQLVAIVAEIEKNKKF